MAVRKRHVIAVAIILLEILGIVWVFPYLPMADLPEHMLAAKVLTHYNDAETNYMMFFTKKTPWNPYSSYFLFALVSGPLLGMRNATRVYLSLAFVLTIVALWFWIRTVAPGRDAQVLPATLLIFGGFFYIGLLNFLFSAPFLIFALALAWRIQQGHDPRSMYGGLLAVCLVLAYLSHAVTFGLTGLMLFLQAFVFFRGRNMRRLILPAMPALLLLVVYLSTEARNDVRGLTLSYDPLMMRLSTLALPVNAFPDPITGAWTYDRTTLKLWLIALAIIATGAVLHRHRASTPINAWGIFLMLVASVLLLPSLLAEGQGLAFRGAYFAAPVLVALLPPSWDLKKWTRWPMFIVCAAMPLLMATRMLGFTAEMRDLEAVLEKMPAQKIIQPVITEPHSASFEGEYSLIHAAAWYSFSKGGISPYLIATWANHFPVRARMNVIPHAPGEWQMKSFRYEIHQEGTDYFLVRTRDEKIIADLTAHVPIAASAGSWLVFGPNR